MQFHWFDFIKTLEENKLWEFGRLKQKVSSIAWIPIAAILLLTLTSIESQAQERQRYQSL